MNSQEESYDPADDPQACSKCGVHIGLRNGDYCDGCEREMGLKPPMTRCFGCHEQYPQEHMERIDLSDPDEYYPQFQYLCGSCSGGDADAGQ
jgi:hypothetical protein